MMVALAPRANTLFLIRRAPVARCGYRRAFSNSGGGGDDETLPVVGAGVPVGTPRANWKTYGYETRCASVVQVSDYAVRRVKPISLPIVLGSTFELEDAAHGERLHAKHEAPYADGDGYVYGRWGSPTNEGAARQLAALEGVGPESAGGCMLFSSGMSAITGALSAVLQAGDHVVLPYTVYGGTREWMEDFAKHWGVEFTMINGVGSGGPQAYAEALRPNTKVVYAESPANPTNRLTDLRAVRQVIEEHHAVQGGEHARPWLMCDGTFATPYHQRSLEAGVDVSIHSATKYIGGHSDILAGAVTSNSAEYMHKLAKVQKLMGAPLAPLESFLLARGLRTLHVRMDRHGENALQIAEFLEEHPLVATTHYPGLPSHADHELAKQVYSSGGPSGLSTTKQTFGGMLSFELAGNPDTALRRGANLCSRLQVITLAVSLGGTESLISHPPSMTHAMIPREDRLAGGLKDGLVRLSVGLESVGDLIADLSQALDTVDEQL